MMDFAYQLAKQNSEILGINKSHPKIENRAYLLSKRLLQKRQINVGRECDICMTRPRNGNILGLIQIQYNDAK